MSILDSLSPRELQFLEAETRSFKCVDKPYIIAQVIRSQNKDELETFQDFYINKGFAKQQIKVIKEALTKGINVTSVITSAHTSGQIRALARLMSLTSQIDRWTSLDYPIRKLNLVCDILEKSPSLVGTLTPEFDEAQLKVIRAIASEGIVGKAFLDHTIPSSVMKVYMEGVRNGIYNPDEPILILDVKELKLDMQRKQTSSLANAYLSYPKDIQELLALGDKNGVDLRSYLAKGFSVNQLKVIFRALFDGLDTDINIIANLDMDAQSMDLLRKDLGYGRDVSLYAQPNITFGLRKSIRHALIAGEANSPVLKAMYPNLSRSKLKELVDTFQELEQELYLLVKENKSKRTKQ